MQESEEGSGRRKLSTDRAPAQSPATEPAHEAPQSETVYLLVGPTPVPMAEILGQELGQLAQVELIGRDRVAGELPFVS